METGEVDPTGEIGDWCWEVERAGGAVVLSLNKLPETLDWAHLLGSGDAHGGFMICML